MIGILYAIPVGVLFATGTYLLLRRSPVRLILGLGLLGHGVNLLLFDTSSLKEGLPPIVLDPANVANELDRFVDPLPQALILTAIVISFAITAFVIVLVNRRHRLATESKRTFSAQPGEEEDVLALSAHTMDELARDEDDYQWLEYRLSSEEPTLSANKRQGSQ